MESKHIPAKKALQFLRTIIDYYGFNSISLSFNGGKDCTVLFHLLRACISQLSDKDIQFQNLHTIYFREAEEFDSIDRFTHEIAKEYNLTLLEINGSFTEGLTRLLANAPIQAILMGQRSTLVDFRNKGKFKMGTSICEPV